MADTSVTDPGDMDPISQTFTAANALNVKHFVDKQFEISNMSSHYSNMLLQNAVQFQSQLNHMSLTAMGRLESVNNAIITKAASILLDQSANDLGDAAIGQETIKSAQTTPPVYQDPSSSIAALAAQVSALTQFVQGLSVAPAVAAKA